MLELYENGLPYAYSDEYGCSEFYYDEDGIPYCRDWQEGMSDWSAWYETSWEGIANILAEAMRENKEVQATRFSKIFKSMLDSVDFALEKYGDGFGLMDLQGANWGDIESDRFKTPSEIVQRLDIYIEDSYNNDLHEEASYYYGDKTLPDSCEDWLSFMDNHSEFKEKYMFEYEVIDMIVNHLEEVNLDEVMNFSD